MTQPRRPRQVAQNATWKQIRELWDENVTGTDRVGSEDSFVVAIAHLVARAEMGMTKGKAESQQTGSFRGKSRLSDAGECENHGSRTEQSQWSDCVPD